MVRLRQWVPIRIEKHYKIVMIVNTFDYEDRKLRDRSSLGINRIKRKGVDSKDKESCEQTCNMSLIKGH